MTNENNQISLLQSQNEVAVMAYSEREGLNGTLSIKADKYLLRNTVKAYILKAYIAHLRTIEVDDLTYFTDEVTAEILRAYKSITVEEIGLALHKGAMGEYEKVYSLSVAFFISSIRNYMNSEARVEAAKKYLSSTQLLLPTNKKSPEQIAADRKEIMLKSFEHYKLKKYYEDHGNYVFDCLAYYGVLNFTDEDKSDFYKKGKQKVVNKLSGRSKSMDERNENRRMLEEVKKFPDHYLIFIEMKKIALNKFYADLSEMDTELKDLIQA